MRNVDDNANDKTNLDHVEADRIIINKILDLAVADQRFENTMFWQRSIFCWGFIAVAMIAYNSTKSEKIALVFACFGMVCSACWTLVNRTSKMWQDHFVQVLHAAEMSVFGKKRFIQIDEIIEKGKSSDENTQMTVNNDDSKNDDSKKDKARTNKANLSWLAGRTLSVTGLSIAMSDFVFMLWIGLVLYSVLHLLQNKQFHPVTFEIIFAIGLPVFSLFYIIIMIYCSAKSSSPLDDKQATRPHT